MGAFLWQIYIFLDKSGKVCEKGRSKNRKKGVKKSEKISKKYLQNV